MRTILRILHQAGDWHYGLHSKIHNSPHMALVIEVIDESGPCGLAIISVAHYGEQNGDFTHDPEMCFELGFANESHMNPLLLSKDYVSGEQWSRTIALDHYIYLGSLHQQHQQLNKVWENQRLQGFSEAFEQQKPPHA